jgi:hypothetical protein
MAVVSVLLCLAAGDHGRRFFLAAAPPAQDMDKGSAIEEYLQDQVTDVNWMEFAQKSYDGSRQCVPHCLKTLILPQPEGTPLHHTAGKVAQCVLWECIPNAIRMAGKPGPLLADGIDVLRMKLEEDRRKEEQLELERVAAARMQAVMERDRELAIELAEVRKDQHVAWACAGVAGVMVMILGGYLYNGKKPMEPTLALVEA